MHKDHTLGDAVAQAHKVKRNYQLLCFYEMLVMFCQQLLGLEGVVPLDRCRLVRYDEYTETLDQSFDENQVSIVNVKWMVVYKSCVSCVIGNDNVRSPCGRG